MKNTHSFLNFAFLGAAFLVLTGIKFLSPEAPAPIDEIGMKLYRPIFFGKTGGAAKSPVVKKETETAKEEAALPVKSEEKEVTKTNVQPVKVEPIDNSSDEAYFTDLIQGYKTNVLSQRKYRNDVVVRYYKHEPDGDNANILVDYGFYLHVRPVAEDRFKIQNSNVIYYGHEFPERDLKLIAYLLVKNGIPIKRIQAFKNFDGWKKKSIEIGGSASLDKMKTLTLSDIRSFSVQQ